MRLEHAVEGAGPVVVLLHGFPLNRAIWDDQRKVLSTRFRVIVPDLRGMGASPVIPGTATMDQMADDVIALLDGLEVSAPVTVGGLSMGGYVVLSLMERYPDRLRAAMLVDTKAGADTPEAAANRRGLADRTEAAGNVDEIIESFLPKVLGKTTHADRLALVQRTRQIMGTTSPAGGAAALRGMAERPDRTPVLSTFAAPTLVIVGEEDTLTPPTEARQMADALADARLETIAAAGHLSCMENPDAVSRAMRAFLESLG